MIGSVRKFSDALDKAAQGLTVLSVSSFTLLLFAAVICRYLLKTSILFEEEGSKILFVWACFMGASVAYKRKAHIWFNFIERFIGCRGIAISDLIIHASTFCFFSYLFVDSINFLLQIWGDLFPPHRSVPGVGLPRADRGLGGADRPQPLFLAGKRAGPDKPRCSWGETPLMLTMLIATFVVQWCSGFPSPWRWVFHVLPRSYSFRTYPLSSWCSEWWWVWTASCCWPFRCSCFPAG